MPRDNQTKMSKTDTKNSKKRAEPVRRRKQHDSSDDDASFHTDDSDVEMDTHEYRKFLKKIFPSKHLDKKIKAGERLKKALEEEEEDSDEEEEEQPKKMSKSKKTTNKKPTNKKTNNTNDHKKSNRRRVVEEESEEESEEEDSSEEDDDTEEYIGSEDTDTSASEEEGDDDEISPKSSGKFNIIFTIGGKNKHEDESEDEDEWETCTGSSNSSNSETENEDDPVSSDTEEEEEEDVKPKKTTNKKDKKPIKKITEEKNEELISKLKDVLSPNNNSNETSNDVIAILKDLQSKNKKNDLVNECLRVCEEKMTANKEKQEKKVKKEKARNGRIFKKILRDKNTMNDFEFYDKLETSQQKKIIKELREINKITRIEKPYRLTLLDSDMPVIFKSAAMKKISSLRYMEPGSGEYYKIKNWVDTFMRIPFSEYKTLPISITDGVDKCHEFMGNAQKTLDDAVYGLNDAKMQIMQLLGQLVTNPQAIGSAIAIHGPPGTGKTSLVKEGISKILNRPFAFIALGGATDSSFLEGHGYTYEGSTWGKIVQILIDSKCMNPVIYFDELDKISDTPKGEEIAGILTHLTDTSQNSQFHDKYFSEIDFDLSKCLFIFSYNDESKVNSILKDRMYRIQTKGYNQKQKTVISNNYLLPKIRDQIKFSLEDIIIPDQTLHYIIEHHCLKEDGVRNLKRCLEIIYTKLNLYRLMRPGSNLFEEDMSLKVEFPFTVTKDIVDKMIKKPEGLNPSLYHLYI